MAQKSSPNDPMPPTPRTAAAEPAPGGTGSLGDFELAQRVASQDSQAQRALEVLFLRHSNALLRFLCRVVRNDEEAEDLVHDAFVKLAEKAGSYRGESPFRTWLFSLALNLVRSRKRREALEERTDETILERRPELSRPRPEADPVQNVETKEQWERVEAALSRLADPERETFLLYWFGELPYAEISRITGVSISAAKVRVHRALGRIAEMVGEKRR